MRSTCITLLLLAACADPAKGLPARPEAAAEEAPAEEAPAPEVTLQDSGENLEIAPEEYDNPDEPTIDTAADTGTLPEPEDCADGRDNDLDGLVDCEDGDCAGETACVEDCTNGRDDDGDGLWDCRDDDCLGICPHRTRSRVLGGRLSTRFSWSGSARSQDVFTSVDRTSHRLVYSNRNARLQARATAVRGSVQVWWSPSASPQTCTWQLGQAEGQRSTSSGVSCGWRHSAVWECNPHIDLYFTTPIRTGFAITGACGLTDSRFALLPATYMDLRRSSVVSGFLSHGIGGWSQGSLMTSRAFGLERVATWYGGSLLSSVNSAGSSLQTHRSGWTAYGWGGGTRLIDLQPADAFDWTWH